MKDKISKKCKIFNFLLNIILIVYIMLYYWIYFLLSLVYKIWNDIFEELPIQRKLI